MESNPLFSQLSLNFWAYVRLISRECGYTDRKTGNINVPLLSDVESVLQKHRILAYDIETEKHYVPLLMDYFVERARTLKICAENNLMRKEEAEQVFNELKLQNSNTQCYLPDNKQKGDKKNPNFFSCIINLLIEKSLLSKGEYPIDYNPRNLIMVKTNDELQRVLSRWMDGAFPATINPIAVWEIKEYYYTTTFGSRIADGVFETQLDGFELQEIRNNLNINIYHYLMVDAYDTWWKQGKSYLCRLYDMLHMGLVTEIIFGKEVLTRIPVIVDIWVSDYHHINISKINTLQ